MVLNQEGSRGPRGLGRGFRAFILLRGCWLKLGGEERFFIWGVSIASFSVWVWLRKVGCRL